MRGADETSGSLFSYVDLEGRFPARHPLHKVRQVVNDALASLDEYFDLYVDFGRPSIAPERLIRASLLQILFSIRSGRQLMEQMQYDLLFRWFVALGIDDPVWVPTVFTKNRNRLLTTEMSCKVMAAFLAHREVAPLLSEDFPVDGTAVRDVVPCSCRLFTHHSDLLAEPLNVSRMVFATKEPAPRLCASFSFSSRGPCMRFGDLPGCRPFGLLSTLNEGTRRRR